MLEKEGKMKKKKKGKRKERNKTGESKTQNQETEMATEEWKPKLFFVILIFFYLMYLQKQLRNKQRQTPKYRELGFARVNMPPKGPSSPY